MMSYFQQKIEKLQANLHLLNDDSEISPPNTHTIFVDSAEEGMVALLLCVVTSTSILMESLSSVATFDAAKHFNTAPEFVTRTFSRPTLDSLGSWKMAADKPTVKV